MKKYLQISLILAVILFIFNSCYKKDDYSNVPVIELKEFKRVNLGKDNDSFYFTVSFVDGDGDLGVGQPSSSNDTAGISKLNFYLDYYEKINGEFKRVKKKLSNDDTISYPYRIPILNTSDKQRTIKGDISLRINWNIPSIYNNIIKFKIYITDRAEHKSNVVETPEMQR